VTKLSQFLQDLSPNHLIAVDRIISYYARDSRVASEQRELEKKGLDVYFVSSIVRVHSGAYDAVVHQDAIARLADLFAVEDCSRPWEPSQAEISAGARGKAWTKYINRARQCRSEAQKVYRACVKALEPNRLTNLEFFIENSEASIMPSFRGHLVTEIFSELLLRAQGSALFFHRKVFDINVYSVFYLIIRMWCSRSVDVFHLISLCSSQILYKSFRHCFLSDRYFIRC
jgi:hypothetical protein